MALSTSAIPVLFMLFCMAGLSTEQVTEESKLYSPPPLLSVLDFIPPSFQ